MTDKKTHFQTLLSPSAPKNSTLTTFGRERENPEDFVERKFGISLVLFLAFPQFSAEAMMKAKPSAKYHRKKRKESILF